MFDLKEVLKNFKGKHYIPNDDGVDYQQFYEQQKQRADELQDLIERFLYANRESDVYAICSEEELLSEYERIK